jgi:hypothetical protein
MELLLNLAWLLVAVVSAVGLLRHIPRERNSAGFWVIATAMLCVIVLLFPVISMTDDLHAEVFMTEESGKRRVIAIQVEHLLANLQAVAAQRATAVIMPAGSIWSTARENAVPRPLEGTRPDWSNRPPPAPAVA